MGSDALTAVVSDHGVLEADAAAPLELVADVSEATALSADVEDA